MSKSPTFALPIRINALLCCGAAVLLSACGGAADGLDGQQSLAAMTTSEFAPPGATGATAQADAAAAPPAPEAVAAPAAQAAPSQAVTTPTPTPAETTVVSASAPEAGEGVTPAASNQFGLSVYQAEPAPAQAGSQPPPPPPPPPSY